MPDISETFLIDLLKDLDSWFEKGRDFPIPDLSNNLHPYKNLFSPIEINSVKIPNRIVMGPMGNVYMVEESGRPAEKMIQFLTERAEGGTGLITTGLVPVGQGIDPGLLEPDGLSLFPRIDRSSTRYSGWHTLVGNIHSHGARLFIQLSPGAGRVGSPLTLMTKLQLPVSASWNSNFYLPQVPCRPLSDLEARVLIRRMAQASVDAQQLGMDGIYLHGHEGYLLDQMTNPAFNRRLFGRYSDKSRFGTDMVQAIRKRVGKDFPILYRIGLSLGFNASYGRKMEQIPGLRRFRHERLIRDTMNYMAALVAAGVDAFDVDLGTYDNWWLPHPPNSMPPGCYLAMSRLVKHFFRQSGIRTNQGQDVVVVGVGKLGYPDMAEKALRDGDCDMVMLARPLLADADWPRKAYIGKTHEIRPCIGDQEACLKAFVNGTHIQCAVNPRTGFEDVFQKQPQLANKQKRIAVIGAGPSGIIFSLTAANRGHHVDLYEKKSKIGGMLNPGSIPLIKFEITHYLEYLKRQLDKATQTGNLNIYTKTEMDCASIKKQNYNVVVVAIGGKVIKPELPGEEQNRVVTAVDLLSNPELIQDAMDIVVVGGSTLGCETSLWLSAEKGKRVTILEMLPVLMKNTVTANRTHLIRLLEAYQVRLLNCSLLLRLEKQKVVILRNVSRNVPDPYNTWHPILPKNIVNPLEKRIREEWQEEVVAADLVVVAAGMVANTQLADRCRQEHVADEVLCIGDAFEVGQVWEAVKAGYLNGLMV